MKHYQEKLGPEEPSTAERYFPNRTPRATYAAMISYLDAQLGELVSTLKELGIYENTLILFSSDNGPEVPTVVHMRGDHGHDGARPWRGVSLAQPMGADCS